MSLSDGRPVAGAPTTVAALRDQLADAPLRGAAVAADVGAALDAGRVPVVVPALVASAALRRRGRQDRDARERQQWLTDQLAFAYPQAPAGGWPTVTAAEAGIELVVLDDGGRAPLELGAVGDLAVRRVALEPGQLAVHPLSPRPTWALVAGFDLVALACWALLWSYDFRPLVCALLAVVLAVTLAGVRGFSPLAPRRSVGVRSWPREHALAAGGAAATAAASFAVGLLAIDGLSARDSLVVIVPMVAAGAWIGGGDALAVMWHQSRRRRVVVDVGSTRVLADAPQRATPADVAQEPPTVPMAAVPPDP